MERKEGGREREREREIYIYIYTHIHTYLYLYIERGREQKKTQRKEEKEGEGVLGDVLWFIDGLPLQDLPLQDFLGCFGSSLTSPWLLFRAATDAGSSQLWLSKKGKESERRSAGHAVDAMPA